MNLDSFSPQYSLYDFFSECLFSGCPWERKDLFHFQVEDHGDFLRPLDYRATGSRRVCCLSVSKWCLLSPDAPTADPMEGYPVFQWIRIAKRLHFDPPSDQTFL